MDVLSRWVMVVLAAVGNLWLWRSAPPILRGFTGAVATSPVGRLSLVGVPVGAYAVTAAVLASLLAAVLPARGTRVGLWLLGGVVGAVAPAVVGIVERFAVVVF